MSGKSNLLQLTRYPTQHLLHCLYLFPFSIFFGNSDSNEKTNILNAVLRLVQLINLKNYFALTKNLIWITSTGLYMRLKHKSKVSICEIIHLVVISNGCPWATLGIAE